MVSSMAPSALTQLSGALSTVQTVVKMRETAKKPKDRKESEMLPWLPVQRSLLSPSTRQVNEKLGRMQVEIDAIDRDEGSAGTKQSKLQKSKSRGSVYLVDLADTKSVQTTLEEISNCWQAHLKTKKDMEDSKWYGLGGNANGTDDAATLGNASPQGAGRGGRKMRGGGPRQAMTSGSPRAWSPNSTAAMAGADADGWDKGYSKTHLRNRMKVLREDDTARKAYEEKLRERITAAKLQKSFDAAAVTSQTALSVRSGLGSGPYGRSPDYRPFEDRRAYVLDSLEKQFDDHLVRTEEVETRGERRAAADAQARQLAGWSVMCVHFMAFGKYDRKALEGIKAEMQRRREEEQARAPQMNRAAATRILGRFVYRCVLKQRLGRQKSRIHLINQFLHHYLHCMVVPFAVKKLLKATRFVQSQFRKGVQTRRARSQLARLQVETRHIQLIRKADAAVSHAEEKLRAAALNQTKLGRQFPAKCAGMVARATENLHRCQGKKREFESINEQVLHQKIEYHLRQQSAGYQKAFSKYCQDLAKWKKRQKEQQRQMCQDAPYLRQQLRDTIMQATQRARELALQSKDGLRSDRPLAPLPHILFNRDVLTEIFSACIEQSVQECHRRVVQVSGFSKPPLNTREVIRKSISESPPTTPGEWRPGHRAGAKVKTPRGSKALALNKRPRLEDVIHRRRASLEEARNDALTRLTEYQFNGATGFYTAAAAGKLKGLLQKSEERRKSVRYQHDPGY